MRNLIGIKWLLIVILFTISLHPKAAEICVSNSTEFQAALSDAATNGEVDHIKMKPGNYPIIGGNKFSYVSNGGLNTDLKISGGWIDFNSGQCNLILLNTSAFQTSINGLGLNGVLDIQIGGSADFEIAAITFLNGRDNSQFSRGAGLYMRTLSGYNGDFDSALSANGGYKTTVRNNLFITNHGRMGATVSLVNNNQRGIYFTNNTVMENTTDGSNYNTAAVYIFTSGISQAFVANNIVWDNEFKDLFFSGAIYLFNNNLGLYTSNALHEANNFSMVPEFDFTINGNVYTPAYNSSLHNQGLEPPTFVPAPTPFESDWNEGNNDTFGHDRIVNGRIDIGSFETPEEPPIFENGFEEQI